MKVCLLYNPRAGSAELLGDLRERLAERHRLTVRETADGDDLKRKVLEAARGRFDVVAVAGGDGTIHAAVNGLAPKFPRTPLAFFPLGTGNDLCRTLAVSLDPLEAVGLLKLGRKRAIDVVRVEGGCSAYLVNAATGGFSGRVASDVTPEVKAFWGPLAYLRGAAGPLADKVQYRVTLRFDGGPAEEVEALNVVVANGRTAAGGLPVAPLGSVEDGLLDVVLVRATDAFDVSVVLARLMAGDYLADENVDHRLARRLELTSDPPMPFSIDGELCEGPRFTFEVVPKAVTVFVGPDYKPRPQPAPDDPDDDAPADDGSGGFGRRVFGLVGAGLRMARELPRAYTVGLGVAAVAVIAFAWLASGVLEGEWREFNRDVTALARGRASPERTAVAAGLTRLGGVPEVAALTVGVVLLLLTRKRYLDAATLLAVAAGCGGLELLLKGLFAVPRPAPLEGVTPVGGYSFPSGHALRAFGLYGCLAALLVTAGPRDWWRWAGAALLVLLAIGVGWTRVYLLVHWPTDVIAAALAALAWVTACLVARSYARARTQRRLTAPPAAA